MFERGKYHQVTASCRENSDLYTITYVSTVVDKGQATSLSCPDNNYRMQACVFHTSWSPTASKYEYFNARLNDKCSMLNSISALHYNKREF